VIGSCSREYRVLVINLAKCKVFYPTRIEKQHTHHLCVNLAVATCLLLEVADPKKATSDYLSKGGGRFSWAVSSEEEEKASIGMRATNDPSESQFATFTEALATGRRVGVDLASGIGQTRFNNDFGRAQLSWKCCCFRCRPQVVLKTCLRVFPTRWPDTADVSATSCDVGFFFSVSYVVSLPNCRHVMVVTTTTYHTHLV